MFKLWIQRLALALLAPAAVMIPMACGAEEDSAALLEQVRGDDFDARQVAIAKLQALGESARPVLEKAASSDDAELRDAAAKLLARLHKAVLRLIAYDRDGNPAAGAEADVHINESGRNANDEGPRAVTLDISGHTDLVLAPGGPLAVSAAWKVWLAGHVQPSTWQMSLADGVNPVVYTLEHSGSIAVRVNDLDGKPVKNAQVSLHNGVRFDAELLDEQLLRWGNNNQFNANANEQGEAKVENVAEGVYQVVVRAEGFASAILSPRRIREGETAQASAVLQPSAMGKIQFVFLQADGKPVKSKQVDFTLEPLYDGPNAVEVRRGLNILRQWGGRNRQQNPTTDDSGKLVLDNVAPGKYDLLFRSDGKTPQHAGPLTVASGQTLDLGELTFAPGGSIAGKVTGVDEKSPQFVYVIAVPEQELVESLQENAQADWRYMRGDVLTIGRGNVQHNGSYEIKDLLPGRYAIVLNGQNGPLAYIFGFEVTAEKTALGPDFPLPKAAPTQELKGRVTLPNGKPAANARIFVTFANQNGWQAGCDNEGLFRIQAAVGQGDPVALNVKFAGCKHKLVDLAHLTGKLDQIDVRLETLGHGDIHVKVVDESGKPLPGASVSPGFSEAVHRKSNKNGEADLAGLAAGPRTLGIDLDGYYVQDAKVTVEADKETSATVHLHSGFVLKGRLELPAGVEQNGISVALYGLSGARSRFAPVSDDGRFSFTGAVPGSYVAFATGPGLVTREPAVFTLKAEQPDVPGLKLDLVRVSGAALAVGAQFEGYTATLQPKGAPADPRLTGGHVMNGIMNGAAFPDVRRNSGIVDSDGRLEFWGLAPGACDLYMIAPTRMYNYYGRATKTAAITRIMHDIQVPVLKSFKDLSATKPFEMKFETGAAAVSGLVRSDVLPSNASGGNLILTLKGASVQAMLSFAFPGELRAAATRPVLLGEAPAGLKPPEPGQFSVKGLPAGEYTLTAEVSMYRTKVIRRGQGFMSTSTYDTEKREPQVLKTFTVKDGEALDLGTLSYTAPKDALENKGSSEDAEGEDQVPAFQP